MRRRAARLICVVVVVVAPSLPPQASSAGGAREVRRVLIINVFDPLSSPGVAALDQAIVASLKSSPYQIELYTEDLEMTLFPDEAHQQQFREWYTRKYHDRKPDVIVAVGLEPITFMAQSHKVSFPDTPIVFCGSTEEMLGQLKLDSDFTGLWEVAQPEKTLIAALRLRPDTKHVVVVGGVGAYDRYLQAIARKSFRKYESRFDFLYLTDLDMPTLLERLEHLPDDTIVYHTSLMQDASGARFIDATQSVPLIASASTVPVFVVDDVDLGRGAAGGDVLSFASDGRVVGEMAVRVLNGEKPQDIPIAKSANVYMFDWRALHRWGLKESDLPPGSIVLNRETTVWESYKWYIIGGIALFLAEALLIFALLRQGARARKAEAELVISYERIRMAVEAGRFMGWDFELKSGQNRWFGDLQDMLRTPSENYSAQIGEFSSRVHPDDRDRVSQLIDDARQSAQAYIAEFRLHRTDGTVRWVIARGKFYYSGDGAPQRMLGLAADITDRKLAEQKLHESEDRLAGIVGSAMDAIIAVDAERRILLFNAAAEKMFSCTKDEAIGTVIDRFIPQRFRSEHIAHMRHFGESGITARMMGTPARLWAVRTNGQEFPMEASITQLESDGRKMFTVIIRDITERCRAEEAIRESEERFRLVANTAPVMIWTAGTDRKCSYVNKTWLDFTGRPLEAELGDGWAGGLHPDDLARSLQTYREAFDRRESFELQYRLRRHDGEYRWVLDKGVPRFNPDGTFAGYIGSCIDITERKLAEEGLATIGRRLIEAQEEERAWIGRELHDDISQRLALLAVELDRFNQHISSTPELSDQIGHAQERISEIAKDVQGLSHRLHSSKLEYLGLATAANSFCKELSEQNKVEVQFKHAGIPRNLPKEVSLCLFRVLQEALQNAVKHSGVRSFAVDLQGTADVIDLTVADLGSGFSEHEAFTRNGLGLISMRERLQLVRGELSVKSRPGAGTTIHARVPLKAKEYRAMAG